MLQEIQEIIFRTVGRRDVTEETDFIKDLKLNSFDIVNVITAFEEVFKMRIPTRELWKIRTVNDLLAYLETHGFRK